MNEPAPLAAPAPGQPEPMASEPAPGRRMLVPGFLILVLCLFAGEWLKARFGLILPGNILGLFILLALLATGLVPLRWVEAAARLLLWLLPFLFIPIFTLAMRDKAFWAGPGRALAGATILAVCLLWIFTGHFAQWLLTKRQKSASAPR